MNRLCIFAKPPVAGKTKSRLSAEIGEGAASELSALMLQFLIDEARDSKADEIFLYIPLSANLTEYKSIDCRGLTIKYQKGSELGEKMSNLFFENVCEARRTVLIGSDCISVDIESAFKQLETVNVVVQPAEDGGYVLIGMSKLYKQIFEGVKWSTQSVMQETKEILDRSRLNYSLLKTGFDIDEKKDLIKLRQITHIQHAKGIQLWLTKNFK